MITIMDKIWLENGLDMRMSTYKVQPTEDQVGLIQIVTKSRTKEQIHKDEGGTFGALKKSNILKFIER